MSIELAQSRPWLNEWTITTSLSLVGLALAWVAGVFRQRSVLGPARLEDPMLLGRAWTAFFVGICMWLFSQATLLVLIRGGSIAPTQPSEIRLTPSEQIQVAASSGVFGVIVFLLADMWLLPRETWRQRWVSSNSVRGRRVWLAAFVGALIVIPWTLLASVITQKLWQRIAPTPDHEFIRIIKTAGNPILRWSAALTPVLIAPLFEELMFRGHLQTVLAATFRTIDLRRRPAGVDAEPSWTRWTAILLTSLAFIGVHAQGWMWAPLFVLSIGFGYLYERSGNLFVPVLVHAAFNALSVGATIFSR